MSDADAPAPASPGGHSSDRAQSDADAVATQRAAREQAEVNQGLTNDRIDKLITASERQSETNEELALATVEYQERARTAKKRFRITFALIVLGFGLLYWRQDDSNSKINGIVTDTKATVDSGVKTRQTLLDCVQPTGQCYQQGQKRTAEVVGTLNEVTALAAACAPDYVALPFERRKAAIELCIRRGLPK